MGADLGLDRLGSVESYSRRIAPEKSAQLPGLNDPYKAAATQENNEISRLVLVMGKDGFKLWGKAYIFLQYMYLGTEEFGFTPEGQVFRFLYADLQPKLVSVYGRNLLRIADYISLKRMPWIRQADRDFKPSDGVVDDEPIIMKIEISEWKPEEQQRQEAE
ncbi:MAG: hypothetical protein ACLQVF_00740 [Isosphaeraceae bacterium]